MHQIMRTFPLVIDGSGDLYKWVRAAFIVRGSSLNAWCKENGINRQSAEKALKGERFSRAAVEIRKKLIAELSESERAR